jgi:hypothetical protein
MKNKPVQILTEYLKCITFHLSFYPLFVLIASLGNAISPTAAPHPLWWLPLGLALLMFFHLRDKAEKFLVLFLGHLAIFVACIGLPVYPHLSERIITGVFLIIYLIYSLNIRVGAGRAEDKAMPRAVAFGLTFGALFLLKVQGGQLYLEWLLVNLIDCVMISLVIDFLEEYCRFLFVNESSTGYIPADAILKRGLTPVLIFDALLGILMALVCHLEWLTAMWDGLLALLKRFTRWFFSHFAPVEAVEEELLTEPVAEQMEEGMMPYLAEDMEPAMIWVILQNIMTVAVLILLVVFVFWALIRIILFLRDSMRNRMYAKLPETEEATEDIREILDIPGRRTIFSRKIFSKESNNDKVRRAFRKYVRERNRSGLRLPLRKAAVMTARDWEKALETDADTLTHTGYGLYEKARYSGSEVSDQDVNLSRKLFRTGSNRQ